MGIKAKILAVFTVIALAALMSCGGGAAPSGGGGEVQAVGLHGSPDEEYYQLQFVSGVEYWFPVYEGFKQAGNLLGVKTFYVGCTEYDANKEVEVFEQTLAKNPKGIYLSPITAEAFKEPVDRAIAQGVAVVTMASDSPDSKRHGYITSDNVNEGQHAARAIAQALGGQGKVMTLRNPGQTNHDIRIDTFIATMRAEFPNIQVVADSPTNQDPDKAYSAVMTVAQMHPDLGAVFMPEASSAMGASRAAVELGGGKANIKVMCCDVNEQILDMLQTGDMFGAINPDQGMQGWFGMLVLFTAAHPELINPMNGKKAMGLNPTYIPYLDNGLNLVTAENAQYFYVDKYAESLGYKNIQDMLGPGGPK
ncbi:MAG: substrate-binding domain-containing protein [Treponema sp.]|jgi:ribose transport system substrate-binding protein|nr:substrate-binding domain-containing protein [Treponema sp.]